jgi:hypothetical protein
VESEWRVSVLFSVFLVPVWDSGVQVYFSGHPTDLGSWIFGYGYLPMALG